MPPKDLQLEEAVWDSIGLSIHDSFGIKPSEIADTSFVDETRRHLSMLLMAHNESYGRTHFPKSETIYKDGYNDRYIERELSCAVSNNAYSQYDLAELSKYMCLADANLIPKTRLMEALHKLCLSTGWVLPSRKVCFVSERPEILKTDDRGLPHCVDGPAIKYSDGFAIYAWHGQPYPAEWVKNPPRPAIALHWSNLEQRRVACEMVGWDNIIDELGGQLIDKDDDPGIGELVRVNLPGSGVENFLRVTCGTGRRFALPVPPEMKTALEANAWTWGLEPHQYKPEVRT